LTFTQNLGVKSNYFLLLIPTHFMFHFPTNPQLLGQFVVLPGPECVEEGNARQQIHIGRAGQEAFPLGDPFGRGGCLAVISTSGILK
jgi:hypothetical protein